MVKKQGTKVVGDLPPDSVELVTSNKRVAKDGSKRGLSRRKHVKEQLLDTIRAAIVADGGGDGWDPVVMMSVIAHRAFSGYPAVDDNGNPVIDEVTGVQLMVPPNPELALVAGAKVAPFLHGHVKPREIGDDDRGGDPDEKKELVLTALENMGVKVNRDG